jgi:hypothetical protein
LPRRASIGSLRTAARPTAVSTLCACARACVRVRINGIENAYVPGGVRAGYLHPPTPPPPFPPQRLPSQPRARPFSLLAWRGRLPGDDGGAAPWHRRLWSGAADTPPKESIVRERGSAGWRTAYSARMHAYLSVHYTCSAERRAGIGRSRAIGRRELLADRSIDPLCSRASNAYRPWRVRCRTAVK